MNLNTTNTTPLKYCDWRVEIYDCHNSQLWLAEVIFSTITYGLLAISGGFIFWCRFKYVWQGLFVDHGGGIRPLPREMGQELAWTFLSYGAVTYLIGIIYTIPVNYTRGTSALVSVQTNNGGANNNSNSAYSFTTHELFLPTPGQLNICLLVGCLWPSLIALPCAILSGLSRDRGDIVTADRFSTVQYIADFLFDIAFSLVTAYYGINFMLILRGSLRQSENKTGASFFKQNSSSTRKAFHRLKYTMTYLCYISGMTGPCWLIWGIAHESIVASINNVNLFYSVMWYITGPQPMIAVCQYVFAKRIYQQYRRASTSLESGTGAGDTSGPRSPLSPKSPKPAFLKHSNGHVNDNLNQWELMSLPQFEGENNALS
ncbi:14153_t:CDS:2 [Ambispora leptoticha]|uniref:14153_t:CDS:1 n=1 Tax=Ambispora leptoticha TaxID=144679 RepID=A0A9N9GBZ0_9GLOM|nr:14153_t:CDS:2 [Ambispora leptoticha]